ncbi:hypothetical protein J1780_03615 [Rahnella aceris]|uniref:hypothetical protein n=1 Tax=Rahnella sp. (strain Y9602) TaxID=2703885 RepID=UPI001C2666CE|nr:hypothetical protein [Rahnella aceris]MBU9839043.1 hypothetical protein [Rahnella aceris]
MDFFRFCLLCQSQVLLGIMGTIEQGLLFTGAGLLLVWGGVALGALRRTAGRLTLFKAWCCDWWAPVTLIALGLMLIYAF